MAELKDIKGNPDLVCYQGSDPNTPSTGAVEKDRGAIIYDRKTGLSVYHVVAPQREYDPVDKFFNMIGDGLSTLGIGSPTPPPDRSGPLQFSYEKGKPGYADPLKIAGTKDTTIQLGYTAGKEGEKPKLSSCQVDFGTADDPDFSITIPVTDKQPALKPKPTAELKAAAPVI